MKKIFLVGIFASLMSVSSFATICEINSEGLSTESRSHKDKDKKDAKCTSEEAKTCKKGKSCCAGRDKIKR